MPKFTAPSGLRAEVVIHDGWGSEHMNEGLRYIGDDAKRRLKQLFINPSPIFDLTDIVEDMNTFGFGYADGVYINPEEIQSAIHHVLPVTTVSDDVPNCLWHADNLRVNCGGEEHEKIFQPSAVTMLYPRRLESRQQKETGFGHPALIAESVNAFLAENSPGRTIEPTVESLRAFADECANDQLPTINRLLSKVSLRAAELLRDEKIYGEFWLKQKPGRLILFSNSIVHANDLLRNCDEPTPRAQTIWRRMLPGKKFLTFNLGL